jgi:hypothetical protein
MRGEEKKKTDTEGRDEEDMKRLKNSEKKGLEKERE